MKFKTAYNTMRDGFSMGSYSRIQKQYGLLMDKDGTLKPGVIGDVDVYQMRQEAKKQTLLSEVVKRFVNGDESAIGAVNQGFIDLTDMPTDLMSLHSRLTVAKNKFDTLPLEFRKKYDNDFNKYLSDYKNILAEAQANTEKIKSKTVIKEDLNNE